MAKELKNAITVRGDALYCPLPLAIDSYWACEISCHHCYFRRLNRIWGQEQRVANPEQVNKKLRNGLANKNPKSYLAHALALKKTIRLGNKTDPFQPLENKLHISRDIIRVLVDLRWTFVVQTRFLDNLIENIDLLEVANDLNLLTIMPIISPGAERDWEILERKRTTPIKERLEIISTLLKAGFTVGVNGEPFIPGFHTVKEFEEMIIRLKEVGIKSYNTYNLHLNDHVAKRFCEIGLDLDKIWRMNQNSGWKKIQRKLCKIATKHDMILGCPDFVNTGTKWIEQTNTCCGIDVPNPSRFNTHTWKRRLQMSKKPNRILKTTYEGVGDKALAKKIMKGHQCDNYTMKDAGMI